MYQQEVTNFELAAKIKQELERYTTSGWMLPTATGRYWILSLSYFDRIWQRWTDQFVTHLPSKFLKMMIMLMWVLLYCWIGGMIVFGNSSYFTSTWGCKY